jgi:putative nucleotidyltransferase with HDIG domain
LYDITTYRSESEYSDKRRPDSVLWGKTVEEDLKRRDFTINAMALRILNKEQGISNIEESEVQIVDPYGGKDDLKNKVVTAVGDPSERFEEDALRIMRAIRISAQLGFAIEEKTLLALKEKVPNLKEISWERIGAETMKLLGTGHAADGIQLMLNCGIIDIIMPELIPTKDVKQGGHHIYDVFTHSLEALRACPSSDPVVRLATLLHDIDKPTVAKAEGVRGVTFYNHEVSGARTAKRIAERLKLSKKDQDRIFTLVRWHMFVYESKMTDASIRRFIRRVGKENIHDMMALRIGDRVGGGSKATSWRLTELQKRIGEQFYEPLSLKDMNINGAEIMQILDIKPSKKIGEILNALFEEILDDSSKNTKEYLEKRVRELA